MPTIILPNSKIAVPYDTTDDTFCPRINLAALCEEDLQYLVQYLLSHKMGEGVSQLKIDLINDGCGITSCNPDQITVLLQLKTKFSCPELETIKLDAIKYCHSMEEPHKSRCILLLNDLFVRSRLGFFEKRYKLLEFFNNIMHIQKTNQTQKTKSLVFLSKSKSRYDFIALILSTIVDKTDVLEWFCQRPLYRQGLYNRTLETTLLKLSINTKISNDCKIFLIKYCIAMLNKCSNKNKNYETWSLLSTLLDCKIDKQIEAFSKEKNDNVTLTDLYWSAFQTILDIPHINYKTYREHFNHPLHHLILVFRQNISTTYRALSNDEIKEIKEQESLADDLIKVILTEGVLGYKKRRYNETNNPHLKTAFKGIEGLQIKSIWSADSKTIAVESGPFKECTIHNSDHYWDFLTWGIGINCLEPEGGDAKFLAHLLDGQHRLLLMRDVEGTIIAGQLFHLLLSDIDNPTPVLAVGKTYVLGELPLSRKLEIQNLLDQVAVITAQKMELPLLAILTSGPDEIMHRNIPKVETNEKNRKGIFNTTGYSKTRGLDSGMDYDWCPWGGTDRKEINGIRVFNGHQTLYDPKLHTTPSQNGTKQLLPYYQSSTIATAPTTATANLMQKADNASASAAAVVTSDPASSPRIQSGDERKAACK